MAATAFSLIGMISLKGVDDVTKHLTKMDKQIRKVQKSMVKTGKKLQAVGVGITKMVAPIAIASAGVAVFAGKMGKYADKLLDLSQITGLSVESLQEMEHVASVAGVSFEGLTGTISKFTNQVPEILKGTGAASDALKMLGVTILDSSGEIKSMDSLFPELLDKLRGVENVTHRNALAQDIFGRSLQDIAPVLGMTSKEFGEARKEAHSLGLVFSGGALSAANKYRIGAEKLQAQIGALGKDIAMSFIPLLTDTLIPAMQNTVIPAFRKVIAVVKSVADWFNTLSGPMQKTTLMWFGLLAVVGPVVMIIGKLMIAAKALVPLIKLLTFSQGALNAVMAANPIGLVVTAIVALIAAGIALYNNWGTVSAFLSSTWQAFVDLVVVGVSVIKEQFFNALAAFFSLAESMATFIPVLGERVTALKDKFKSLSNAEKKARAERSQATKETGLANAALLTYEETVAKATEDIAVLGEQEAQIATQRMAMEQEWSDKYIELTQTRAEALIAEKDIAIAEAERIGAETDTIEAFYQEQEKQRMQELTDKRIEHEQTWSDKVFELSATRIEKLNKERDEAIANAKKVGADTTDIQKFYREASLTVEKEKQEAIKQFEDTRKDEYTTYLAGKKEQDLQAKIEVADNEKEWNALHKELIAARQEELKKERDHAIANAEELGAKKEDIDKLYDEKLLTLSEESYDARKKLEFKLLKKKVKYWEKGLSTFASFAGQIGDLVNEYYETEIAQVKDKMNTQKKAIKASKMSEKDKAKALQALEKGTYKKVKAIKIKQAKEDKKLAIFNVIIATALAVMKVAASAPGFFIRIIAIAAIAALGITQIALIKRRPIPSFAKGGGVKGNRGGIEAQVGEGRETELIFPLKTGVNMLLDSLMNKLSGFRGMLPPTSVEDASSNVGVGTVNFHVGTLIADDAGIKKLERSMRKYRIQENQRRGYAQ